MKKDLKMFGMSQKEKSLKENDRLFAELEKWPPVAIDPALDELCIGLAIRVRGATECQSPQASDIRRAYTEAIRDRDRQKQITGANQYRIFNLIAENNRLYITDFHRKCTLRVERVIKLYKTKSEGETTDIRTDQVTRKYRTNQENIDAIRDRILADRAEVSGMQREPLPKILEKIEEHNQWFSSIELDEIPVDKEVEVPGALPKWAQS
jgi:hypothetical protein